MAGTFRGRSPVVSLLSSLTTVAGGFCRVKAFVLIAVDWLFLPVPSEISGCVLGAVLAALAEFMLFAVVVRPPVRDDSLSIGPLVVLIVCPQRFVPSVVRLSHECASELSPAILGHCVSAVFGGCPPSWCGQMSLCLRLPVVAQAPCLGPC